MGTSCKNSEIAILPKWQSHKVWDTGFTLPEKVAKAFK